MTAPISMYEEVPYNLHTKITEVGHGKYSLEAEFVYEYKNVWKVRNAFERFFRDPFDPVTCENVKVDYYRKVKIEGDLENMQYCEICIWDDLTFEEAKEKELSMKQSEEQIFNFHKNLIEEKENDVDLWDLPFK